MPPVINWEGCGCSLSGLSAIICSSVTRNKIPLIIIHKKIFASTGEIVFGLQEASYQRLDLSFPGPFYSPNSPGSVRHAPPFLYRGPQLAGTPGNAPPMDALTPASACVRTPSPAVERPALVQSTSFLDLVPISLTAEPRDWLNVEEGPVPADKGHEVSRSPILSRAVEVELRRRPGEGFGFVIATQDSENGRGESRMTRQDLGSLNCYTVQCCQLSRMWCDPHAFRPSCSSKESILFHY